MWYVMQVCTGTEHRIKTQCLSTIDREVLRECFVPLYEEKKRIQGRWQVTEKIMFPGYVFVVTEDILRLQLGLRKIAGLTRLLGTGNEIVPLSEEEIQMLQRFGGDDHVVGMSEGIIENSTVIIQRGPLAGLEAYIKKIDRHKRKAYLELELFGRVQKIEVGLEIVLKR